MARNLTLARSEAEWLVDLLEDCDPDEGESWRFDMASEVRELFGMVSRQTELKRKAALRKRKKGKTIYIPLNIKTYKGNFGDIKIAQDTFFKTK